MNSFVLLEDNYVRKKSIGLIHKVFILSRRNNQQYSAHCKTKSEVRGGGKKPWKQKGTGRARAGSTRSPLWVGGGKSFGPRKRVVTKKINRKEKQLATLLLFFFKFPVMQVFPELLKQDDSLKNFMKSRFLTTKIKTLIILETSTEKLWKLFQNNKNIEIISPNCLNVKSLLKANQIFLTRNSINLIKKKILYGINE